MEENNNSRTLYPNTYRSWNEFSYAFCDGCSYKYSSFINEDKRVEECLSCINSQDHFYRNKEQPVAITKNEEGRNLAKSVTVKQLTSD
jgi:hypothetical protein